MLIYPHLPNGPGPGPSPSLAPVRARPNTCPYPLLRVGPNPGRPLGWSGLGPPCAPITPYGLGRVQPLYGPALARHPPYPPIVRGSLLVVGSPRCGDAWLRSAHAETQFYKKAGFQSRIYKFKIVFINQILICKAIPEHFTNDQNTVCLTHYALL